MTESKAKKMIRNRKKISSKPLLIIMLFIFADVLGENFIVSIYNKEPKLEEFLLFLAFMLLQILFAPIQAGFSDYYGRKKGLVASLSFSCFSLVLAFLYIEKVLVFLPVLVLATIMKGMLGNTLPLSLAGIADTQDKNYRLSFAISSGTYALAYLFLIFSSGLKVVDINYLLVIIFLILIAVCLGFFRDPEDRTTPDHYQSNKRSPSFLVMCKYEGSLAIKELRHSPTKRALLAYLFWEMSVYSILISQVDFQREKSSHIAEAMMFGYLVGVIILKFCRRATDSTIIKLGYYVSFISLIPYFVFFGYLENISPLLTVCYFFHTLGNAFLSPALLAILAKERKPHEQGKVYGLVDSVDTVSFLVATVFIMLYNLYKLQLFYLVLFSFLAFSTSWLFFGRFKNVRENST